MAAVFAAMRGLMDLILWKSDMPTLQWLGREEAVPTAELAPFRLMEHFPGRSVGDSDGENLLIQGLTSTFD